MGGGMCIVFLTIRHAPTGLGGASDTSRPFGISTVALVGPQPTLSATARGLKRMVSPDKNHFTIISRFTRISEINQQYKLLLAVKSVV